MGAWLGPHPSCGHSVCSNAFIETGDPRCVDPEDKIPEGEEWRECYRLPSDIVGTAFAIRSALPHVSLSEALTYADPSTVRGRSFRSTDGGFCGTGFDRHTIAFAYAWYSALWGPCPASVDRRLSRMKVRIGVCATLETEDPEVRRCYGMIVRQRHAWWIAYVRFARRYKRKGNTLPSWPGMWNLPHPEKSERDRFRAWVMSNGFDPDGIESLAPPDRGEAYETMLAHLGEV